MKRDLPPVSEVIDTLTPGWRGHIPIRDAQVRYAKEHSAKGRAGHLGGVMAQREYPASGRPRDERGRFASTQGDGE